MGVAGTLDPTWPSVRFSFYRPISAPYYTGTIHMESLTGTEHQRMSFTVSPQDPLQGIDVGKQGYMSCPLLFFGTYGTELRRP